MLTKIKLSPHFSLGEMLATQTFNGRGVVYNCESLTPEIYNNLVRVCKFLEDLREHISLPIKVNSGFRCSRVNSKVGGVKDSDHLKGLAVDIDITRYPDDVLNKIVSYLKDAPMDAFRYVEHNYQSEYIHVSLFADGEFDG